MVAERKFKGKWICADMTIEDRLAPVFRQIFTVDGTVESAQAFVCGLGLFELRINGVLADDTVLNPAHTQYSSTVLYREFDIAPLLKKGENEILITLGHSFYNETVATWKWQLAQWRDIPKLLCDFEITYSDSSVQTFATDTDWQVCTDGIITANSIYYGEAHDYRNRVNNWQIPKLATPPTGKLRKQTMEPMRRISTLSPESITNIGSNSYVIASPEMVTGWAKITLPLKCGESITVTYGERLKPDGSVVHIGKGEERDGNWYPLGYIQQDTFIGDGVQTEFEPVFSYKGFKYIQIDSPVAPRAEDIAIYRVANDVASVGEFTCSQPVVNQLHALMRRTVLNNLQGKPTDTPVWEKNGWLGDLNCGLLSMIYNFNMDELLRSFTVTMADCHNEYGMMPVFAPIVDASGNNHPVWNTVLVFTAEALLDFYGQTDFVRELYPTLRDYALKQIDAVKALGWVWNEHSLSDWVAPIGGVASDEANPNSSEGAEICATTFIYKMLMSMSKIAKEIGEDDADYLTAAEKILKAFNNKFYNSEKGCYETTFWDQMGGRTRYRQTSNLLPLAFDMVPESEKHRVLDSLVADIRAKGNHLDTGCTGTRFVLPVLFDNGYEELAYTILTQTTYPSWGYWIEQGFDSAWESWEDTTRSYDHYFLGSYEEALFTHLAGIRDVKKGFTEFTFDPKFNCGLEHLKAKLKAPKGTIECQWKVKNGVCEIHLVVPDGVTFNTELPMEKKGEALEVTVRL